jgi:ATP-dependent RNA helicase RhlE
MQFSQFNLSQEILRAIDDRGYTQPTPVQIKAIPKILLGKDIMALARTGTGKTAAYTLPMLERLKPHANASMSPARHPTRTLILAPTRELAAQVEESVRAYGKYLTLRSAVIYGGVSIDPQIKQLAGGVEILVATPGRLLDHIRNRGVNLSKVETLVLDEADRMLDMGFLPDIKRVLAELPNQRQNLLFSATFDEQVKKLADQLLNRPELIEASPRNAAAENVRHVVHPVARERKRELLSHLIRSRGLAQVLVFTGTRHGANRLSHQLTRDHLSAAAIHGDRTQPERTKALAEFKAGALRVLVATDVAARGLDIEQLPCVVNFDVPHSPEDYVHRVGRTARAGADGEAISLVSPDENDRLVEIERLLKAALPIEVVPGFEPDAAGMAGVLVPAASQGAMRSGGISLPGLADPRETPAILAANADSSKHSHPAALRRSEPVAALFLPPARENNSEPSV